MVDDNDRCLSCPDFKKPSTLEDIIEGYSWIKVKRFDDTLRPDDDLDCMYPALQDHHKKETEFLINKTRELAKQLIAIRDLAVKEMKKANTSKRFSTIGKYHEGRERAFEEILNLFD